MKKVFHMQICACGSKLAGYEKDMEITMKKYAGLKGGIILVVLVLLVVGYYYYLTNRTTTPKNDNTKVSKVQEVLLRDMEWNYPPTPKEVVKYYSDITKCYYNEEYTDSELEELAKRSLLLFDDELYVNNPWMAYESALKKDIEEFKEKGITIYAYTVSSSTDVDFFDNKDGSWARLGCTYTLRQGTKTRAINEIFLLRKDENNHWKIYGWDLKENVNKDITLELDE